MDDCYSSSAKSADRHTWYFWSELVPIHNSHKWLHHHHHHQAHHQHHCNEELCLKRSVIHPGPSLKDQTLVLTREQDAANTFTWWWWWRWRWWWWCRRWWWCSLSKPAVERIHVDDTFFPQSLSVRQFLNPDVPDQQRSNNSPQICNFLDINSKRSSFLFFF